MAEQNFIKYDFGKNCVCVGRISTAIQSHTAQKRDLEAFARHLGYEHIQMFFTTESGFLEYDEKEGWNLVTDFFDSHPDYKVLIVPEISRLSRKEHILHKIKDYLLAKKIQLIIKDIKFYLFNEWGEIPKGNEIIFALYASLADSEMRQKKERFSRALRDYKQLGYSIGGKVLFGYDRIKEYKNGKHRSTYIINEKQAEEIRTIYRWYVFGIDGDIKRATILSITKECIERGFSQYLHSKRNVNKCLKEQAYCGQKETQCRIKNPDFWNYHKKDAPKYIPGQSYICTYPKILTGDDEGLFNLAQQRMIDNNSRYTKSGDNLIDKSSKHVNLLAKLLVCPACGTFLNASYRMSTQSRRPHLGKRPYFTYRCNYSRGVIHLCSFKRTVSMPLIDSVIWAYCQKAVSSIINSESQQDIAERISVIDTKIENVNKKIQEFDIESLIKSEDAILRAKTKLAKDSAQKEAVLYEYEERIAKFEKELNDIRARKLELEDEKQNILNNIKVFNSLKTREGIKTNKKQLYNYIHKIVERIEFVGWDKYHTVLKVHFKGNFSAYKKSEYICIYSKTTKNISAFVVHSYNNSVKDLVREELMRKDYVADIMQRRLIKHLESTDDLYWDTNENKFSIHELKFSLDEMMKYYNSPNAAQNPLIPSLGVAIEEAPIRIIKLNVERLDCYSEDINNI